MSDPSAPLLPTSVETFQQWAERRAQRLAVAITQNKAALFDALAAADIARVTVQFDGYGDSGQIEDVVAESPRGLVALPDVTVSLIRPRDSEVATEASLVAVAEAIETIVYDCLEAEHGGWQDNDGAFGDFVFDVGTRTITLSFYGRVMDFDHSEHQF